MGSFEIIVCSFDVKYDFIFIPNASFDLIFDLNLLSKNHVLHFFMNVCRSVHEDVEGIIHCT